MWEQRYPCLIRPFPIWAAVSTTQPDDPRTLQTSHVASRPRARTIPTMKRRLSKDTAVADDGPRRRRQPQVSCNFCRSKKLKCDRGQPCSNCNARGIRCDGQDMPAAVSSAALSMGCVLSHPQFHFEFLVEAKVPRASGSPSNRSLGGATALLQDRKLVQMCLTDYVALRRPSSVELQSRVAFLRRVHTMEQPLRRTKQSSRRLAAQGR